MIRRAELILSGLVLLFGVFAQAAVPKIQISAAGQAKLKAADKATDKSLIEDFKSIEKVHADTAKLDFDAPNIKRDPAEEKKKRNHKEAESEDLLSQEFKAFETEFLNVATPDQVEALLTRYERMSEVDFLKLHPDIQFVMNRVAPMLAFRGVFWRMAPLTHKSIMTQMMLLNLVRSFGENVMIFEPDTQWQAYMAFFGSPSPEQVRQNKQFRDENQMVTFLAYEVAPLLKHSIARLDGMPLMHKVNGRNAAVYFDNRIRFGKQAFVDSKKDAYDPVDRFARIGKAEKYMSMARFYRRLSIIGQLASYNWGGNIALRKELGKEMGINAQLDSVRNFDPFAVEGLTRRHRVEVARGHAHDWALFQKLPARAEDWMPNAYTWFANYARYVEMAWREISRYYEPGAPNYDFLLDPDLFQGRADQIEAGITNLRHMFPLDGEQAKPVVGGISGEEIKVDMRDFFTHAPENLTALMPYEFAHNEDIAPLKALYDARGQSLVIYDDIEGIDPKRDPGLSLAIVVAKGNEAKAKDRLKKLKSKIGRYEDAKAESLGIGNLRDYEFRNYLWGRALKWYHGSYWFIQQSDGNDHWSPVATDEGVAKVQRILGEVRGGRAVMNSLAIFIK